MAKLNIGVIGLGIMGKAILNGLGRNPQVNITSLCDISEKNLTAAKEEYNISSGYTDHNEMYEKENLDAVYIATPDWAHRDPVIDALDAGIHVHVEKPMTTEIREAHEIVDKVRKTGLKLQVSFNHRWLNPYNATWQMIRDGKIGQPLMGYARKNNPIKVPTEMLPWAKDSTSAWFLSCHDIDLMTWWFDQSPVEAHGYGIKKVLVERGLNTYDMIQGQVKYDGGAISTFESCWIYPNTHPAMPDSFMAVIGEKGHIQLDRKMEAIEMSTEEAFMWPRSFLNFKVFGEWVGAFPSCINSFINAILEDRKPYVNAFDGWRSTAVLDALHESVETGETVKIKEAPVWP